MTNCNSIYIHIPFCLSKCKYCDFFSVPCKAVNKNVIPEEYVDSILCELDFYVEYYQIKKVQTIYIGGGTPSLLTEKQFQKILNHIQNKNLLDDSYEFTIEVNPDDITESFVNFLESSIINRISCGIQSMSQPVLDFCGRRAGVLENTKALELLQKGWSKTLSLDLISALPYEKESDFLQNLLYITSLNPHHISMYSLTIEEETKLGQELEQGVFQYDFDKADEMWLKGKSVLEKQGYKQYEVSNFCKENYECKHNLTYWTHKNYIGIGAGAAGSIYSRDGSGIRISNINNIEEYINFWRDKTNIAGKIQFPFETISNVEKIDVETSKFEFFMMGLRKNSGITSFEYENIFSQAIPESVKLLFAKWEKQKKAECIKKMDFTIYRLTSYGLLFLNQFLQELMDLEEL